MMTVTVFIAVIAYTGDMVQIQFSNSTYYTNESTGMLCTIVTVLGDVKQGFDIGVIPIETQPVSARGY